MKKAAPTESSNLSDSVVDDTINILEKFAGACPYIERAAHERFIEHALHANLNEKCKALHIQQVWILYWCTHAKILLGSLKNDEKQVLRTYLSKLEAENGGFGGADCADASVALTYAGLVTSIYASYFYDQNRLILFLRSVRDPLGVIRMHRDGEVDCRSIYCSVAALVMSGSLEADSARRSTDYIIKCQNSDGGFGGEPGSEAHAGYTWCALATLALVDQLHAIDLCSALEWVVSRQCPLTGACNGRPNKLIDTCYSFYVLASQIILLYAFKHRKLSIRLLNERALEDYILKCCQPCIRGSPLGGLSDKLDVKPDWYHTCYGLSALSLMKTNSHGLGRTSPILNITIAAWFEHRDHIEISQNASCGIGEKQFHQWFLNEYLL